MSYCKATLGLGITWVNEMNFGMKHVQSAGLIAGHVDLQSSMLQLLPTKFIVR